MDFSDPAERRRIHGLGRLLKGFRERRGESVKKVGTRLHEQLIRHPELAQSVSSSSPIGGKNLLALESGTSIELSLGEIQLAALSYGIPRLMLDPLFSNLVDDKFHAQLKHKFNTISVGSAMDEQSRHARYSIPEEKLAGTEEVAFVRVLIDPGGNSDIHAHPGDELLLVRVGTVEVRLENSGLGARLNEGDFLHFYAEQVHSVWNTGDRPAEVFVVRFYQLGLAGTRYAFSLEVGTGNLPGRANAELAAALMPFDLPSQQMSGREVVDRFGFGRFLRCLCEQQGRRTGKNLSLKELVSIARSKGLPFSRSKLNRLQNGESRLPIGDLKLLAQVFGVAPLLFFEFAFPAVREAIVVRNGEDYRKIPDNFLELPGAEYNVPCRRLAYSDIALAMLRLQPGQSTPVNRHPGFELLLPLEGQLDIHLGRTKASVAANVHYYAHYVSSIDHRVANPGTEPSSALVIRFYVESHRV